MTPRAVRRQRRGEGGFILVPAMVLIALLLGLGLAMLSIVDTQSSASGRERADNRAFNAAEGVARSAALVLASTEHWQGSAERTRSGSASESCGSDDQTYDDEASNAFGTALADVVEQGYGDDAGDWTVNVCRVSSTTEGWDDTHLDARVAYAESGDPTRDWLWVRGRTTVAGSTKAVVLKVRADRVTLPLPTDFAVKTGSFGTSDVHSTTGTLLSTGGSLLGVVGGLLNDGDSVIEDNAAKVAVRCGILHLLQGQICLAGTLASLAGSVDMLGLSPLNTLLGTDRFVQDTTRQVATRAQLEAWRAEAMAGGTYFASRNDGAECQPTADLSGKVVWIEQVGDGTGRCDITSTRTAKALVVWRGRVRVLGRFNGVLYAANRLADGTPHISSPANQSVLFSGGGNVRGAVFVDGSGTTHINLPRVNCGLLGLNCVLGSVLNLLGLLPDYTAVQRDTAIIEAASPQATDGASVPPGGFHQPPAN